MTLRRNMITEKRARGNIGEKIAQQYLKNKRYTILAAPYQTRVGEIDIIAKDREILVFVEVKSRTSAAFGAPEDAATAQKMERVRRAAQLYLQQYGTKAECRFDVVAIEMDMLARKAKVRHYENVMM